MHRVPYRRPRRRRHVPDWPPGLSCPIPSSNSVAGTEVDVTVKKCRQHRVHHRSWALDIHVLVGAPPSSGPSARATPRTPTWRTQLQPGSVTVSRPVGGILSPARRRGGGHPSERSTWGWPPRGESRAGSPCPRFDLAPGGVYRAGRVTPAAGALLPHRFNLACAPERHRRSAFCGTVLRVAPTGR